MILELLLTLLQDPVVTADEMRATAHEAVAAPVEERILEVFLDPVVEGGIGVDVSMGHRNLYSTEGYDGIRFIGARGGTTIRALTGEWPNSTIHIAEDAGTVEFHQVDIYGGTRWIIFCGDANGSQRRIDNTLRLRDFQMIGLDRDVVWGVSSYGTFMDVRRGEVDLTLSSEHPFYTRNPRQAVFEYVRIMGGGAELLKFTNRPDEGAHYGGLDRWIVVENCDLEGYWQPHTWRGGAGINIQGAGHSVLVKDTMVRGREDVWNCMMLSDGGERHYDVTNGKPFLEGTSGPANGDVLVQTSGFVGDGPGWGYKPIFWVGREYNHANPVVAGLSVRDSGFFGHHTSFQVERGAIALGEGGNPLFEVVGCNTPELTAIAEMGFFVDTRFETMLSGLGAFEPVSAGR